jgi:hypothetical protein
VTNAEAAAQHGNTAVPLKLEIAGAGHMAIFFSFSLMDFYMALAKHVETLFWLVVSTYPFEK